MPAPSKKNSKLMVGRRGSVSIVDTEKKSKSGLHPISAQLLDEIQRYFHKKYHAGDFESFFKDIEGAIQGEGTDDGEIDIDELFQYIVSKIGCQDYSKREVSEFLRDLDVDHSGKLSFDEFKVRLMTPMGKVRMGLAKKTWKRIHKKAKVNPVTLPVIEKLFKAAKHPDVIDGELTAEQKLSMVKKTIVNEEGDIVVDEKGFFNYMKQEHSTFKHDDDFGLMLSACWGIPFIPTYSMEKVSQVIKKAIMEKAGQDHAKAEEFIADTFEHYDKNHDGVLVEKEFHNAMHKFGVDLHHDELKALFEHFDLDGSGEIDGPEFKESILRQVRAADKPKKRNSRSRK